MGFLPVPDLMRDDIYAIEPRALVRRGVKLILLDVDNTLAPYTVNEPTQRMKDWVRGMKDAGLDVFILSNNKGDRPEIFARALGVDFIKKARKPFTAAARAVLAGRGVKPGQAAVVGDQIYTDTLCAKALGATAVLVRPIKFTNIFLRLRYWAEAPFRFAGIIKSKKEKKHEQH